MPLGENDVDYSLLGEINALRATLADSTQRTSRQASRLAELEARANAEYDADSNFLVYGSLGPGGPNHFRLADIASSSWLEGYSVRGALNQQGWGAALGFPGLIWSKDGDKVKVQVLHSEDMPQHWSRLDDFEGEGYISTIAPVTNDEGKVIVGNIYVLREGAKTEARTHTN